MFNTAEDWAMTKIMVRQATRVATLSDVLGEGQRWLGNWNDVALRISPVVPLSYVGLSPQEMKLV